MLILLFLWIINPLSAVESSELTAGSSSDSRFHLQPPVPRVQPTIEQPVSITVSGFSKSITQICQIDVNLCAEIKIAPGVVVKFDPRLSIQTAEMPLPNDPTRGMRYSLFQQHATDEEPIAIGRFAPGQHYHLTLIKTTVEGGYFWDLFEQIGLNPKWEDTLRAYGQWDEWFAVDSFSKKLGIQSSKEKIQQHMRVVGDLNIRPPK